jgi:hypothetical protein
MNRIHDRAAFLFEACCWALLSLPTLAQEPAETALATPARSEKETEVEAVLLRVRVPFLEAIQREDWIAANDLIQETAQAAPAHPQIRTMQQTLQQAIKDSEERRIVKEQFESKNAKFGPIFKEAQDAEAHQEWEKARQIWLYILNCPEIVDIEYPFYCSIKTTSLIISRDAAQKGLQRAENMLLQAKKKRQRQLGLSVGALTILLGVGFWLALGRQPS